MSYPRENIVVLHPINDAVGGGGFDIGNVGTNVAIFHIPFQCSVVEAYAWSNTAVANSFTVGMNTYDGTTTSTNNYIANIVVPDSAGANVAYYDLAGAGQKLKRHSIVLVDVEEAGDAGEEGYCRLVVSYEPETKVNDVDVMIESA